jgi:hypothetical protein
MVALGLQEGRREDFSRLSSMITEWGGYVKKNTCADVK